MPPPAKKQKTRSPNERFVDRINTLVQSVPAPDLSNKDTLQGTALKAYQMSLGVLRAKLSEETRSNGMFQAYWNKAKSNFESDNSSYSRDAWDEIHIALIAYTLDTETDDDNQESAFSTKLYLDFNRACREFRSYEAFPYKSMLGLMVHALNGIRNGVPNPRTDGPFYRGTENAPALDNVHSFCFGQMASFSTDKEVSLLFLNRPGYLFVIEKVPPPYAALGIDQHSPYDEKELIVYPWNTFKIKKTVETTTNGVKVTEVHLQSNEPPINYKLPINTGPGA